MSSFVRESAQQRFFVLGGIERHEESSVVDYVIFVGAVVAFLALNYLVMGRTEWRSVSPRRKNVSVAVLVISFAWILPWIRDQLNLSKPETRGVVYLTIGTMIGLLLATQWALSSRFPKDLALGWRFGVLAWRWPGPASLRVVVNSWLISLGCGLP